MPSFSSPGSKLRKFTPNANPWRFGWPNSADQNFNFGKLVKDASATGIGKVTGTAPNVAVIGAGIAGLTVANELYRSGVTQLDIFDVGTRVGGRNFSRPIPNREMVSETFYEMGAMRFPFFTDPSDENSIMQAYTDIYGIAMQTFPDPGAVETGIYINNGYGPDPDKPLDKPTMLIWKPTDSGPPTDQLKAIYDKWEAFAKMVDDVFAPVYVKGDSDWKTLWQAVANHYANLNFRQMAQLPVLDSYDPSKAGYFGGLGLDDDQLQTFYVIGAGDGSWGAFFDVSSLYIFRTLLCGFGANHQLIRGRYNSSGFNPGPHYNAAVDAMLKVAGNRLVRAPHYRGIQSYAECALFLPQAPLNVSLFDKVVEGAPGTNLYTRTKVVALEDISGSDRIRVKYELPDTPVTQADYDIVVMTPTTWASEMSIDVSGLSSRRLPFRTRTAMNTSHWIKSCKVFFALKENYWSGDAPKIPQVVVTDGFLQDIYAYAAEGDDLGVVVLSYTWEDDASKFLSYRETDLVEKLVEEADRITDQTLGVSISDYIDQESSAIIRWALEPNYHGCAKLYREGRWAEDYRLLAHNQKNGKATGIYLAGEAFSLEGGWTEPALRLALDAVVNIINDSDGMAFNNDFDFSDYLQLDTSFEPTPLNPFT